MGVEFDTLREARPPTFRWSAVIRDLRHRDAGVYGTVAARLARVQESPVRLAPFTAIPDVAWATMAFTKGSLLFAPGAHSITFKSIQKPVNDKGFPACEQRPGVSGDGGARTENA